MTMLVTNSTTALINSSGSPGTATGSMLFTFGGTLGELRQIPNLAIYSRSDTADYALTHRLSGFGRFILDLASGDNYYYEIETNGATVDLAVVAAP